MFEASRPRSATPPPLPAVELDEPPHRFVGAPVVRASTGHQLVVAGVVLAADTGAPIVGARVVRWHASPSGVYQDEFRSLLLTDHEGRYQVETLVPGHFGGLPRHIHFHVSAPGFVEVETRLLWIDRLPPALNALDFELERRAVIHF